MEPITALKLVKLEFDTLENDIGDALSQKEIKVFMDDEKETSHFKIKKYLGNVINKEFNGFYLGWDGEVYPKYKIEKVFIE